jgi:hypothetical protein
MTVPRWVMMCAFGCALIAISLLPPDEGDDAPYFARQSVGNSHAEAMTMRAGLRSAHGWSLWRAYRAARTDETLRRVLGAQPLAHTDPLVWFDADVPERMRKRVRDVVAAERAARGEWRGRAGVALAVFVDTAGSLDGVRVPWARNSGLSVSTQVLAATPATGNRCVVVVRLGPHALAAEDSIAAGSMLMDACAFYDAFGTPGPQIAMWLDKTAFTFSRRLSFAPPDSGEPHAIDYSEIAFLRSEDGNRERCAGGDIASCPLLLLPNARDGVLSFWTYWTYWRTRDLSVPPVGLSIEHTGTSGGFASALLEALARDLGPARFERMWQSNKALPDAYFDVTGEPLAAWLQRRVVRYDGPYHVGPLPTPTSALLSLVAIVALLALSIRTAPRPHSL